MWLTLCGSDRIRVRSTDFRDIYCFEFPKENGGKEKENIFFSGLPELQDVGGYLDHDAHKLGEDQS